MSTPTVKCPSCECLVLWTAEQLFKPFCSERCRLVDLGQWFSEQRRIPDDSTPLSPDEFEPL